MFAALICAEHGYHVKIIGMPAPAKGAMQLAENSFECTGFAPKLPRKREKRS